MKTSRFFWGRFELFCALLIMLLFTYAAAAGAQQQALADKVLRLHVVAASDSIADQQIKLYVRDAVLAYCQPLLQDAQNQQQVRQLLNGHMQQIVNVAQRTLWAHQQTDTVTAQMRQEYYPTRDYTDFSLPAGQYVGLRLKIGAAQGRNWWCVIFPPLCDGAATQEATALTADEAALTRRDGTQYVIRFKTIEILSEIREYLRHT